MTEQSRREFLKASLAAGALATAGTLPLAAERRTAADWVTLGRADVKVTRLAFGTGTMSGELQESLGQDGFTRLVRHAYDNGIRFFETSDTYGETPRMLGIALKGVPRDSYRIMHKATPPREVNPAEKLEEIRRFAGAEYFDIMLLHYKNTPTGVA